MSSIVVRDSYQEFINHFKIDKKDFYNYGIESIISADHNVAKDQYDLKKDALLKNGVLSIRSYGRNGSNTQLFLNLYKTLFNNNKIKTDPTNNAAPRKNISAATGNIINENILNYQVSHVWGNTKNPLLFESVWNICFVPRLFDPFTGHECKGGWNDEFTSMLRRSIYEKYKDIIEDYNDFVISSDISHKIKDITAELVKAGIYDPQLIERFEQDALSEWKEIAP